MTSVGTRFSVWWEAYWYEPMDRTRMRYFAHVIYTTVLVTVWFIDEWAVGHATAPRLFWQPMWIPPACSPSRRRRPAP